MSPQLYELNFEQSPDDTSLSFPKNTYLVGRKEAMFGSNILITDNMDWLTDVIIEANLARWHIKDRFRLSKDDDLVGTSPLRYWTANKIRCHLFICVVTITCLRRIGLKMVPDGNPLKRIKKGVSRIAAHPLSPIYSGLNSQGR